MTELTCWPKGFLDSEEAAALLSALGAVLAEFDTGEGLTTEEEMAKEKLEAALEASKDEPLRAALLRDEQLAGALCRLYLDPLRVTRGGGGILMDTLRAYFEAGENASAAASALGVNRRTVSTRLGEAEQLIGFPLEERSAEIQAALMLESTRTKESG